jgi:hypothetical protein
LVLFLHRVFSLGHLLSHGLRNEMETRRHQTGKWRASRHLPIC